MDKGKVGWEINAIGKIKKNKIRGKKGEPIGDNDDILLMSEGIWGKKNDPRSWNNVKTMMDE
jgi:hypothetical protein